MLAFHHFQPQKDGDFRGLARPQQKTQKDLSHQRPKDKFNQSEKPATSRSSCRRRFCQSRVADEEWDDRKAENGVHSPL